MKTYSMKPSEVEKTWFVVDADGMVLGRMAAEIAKILRGKHKAGYTPHVDCGDNVIVINAEKVKLTGRKLTDKVYYRHTGHPGGIKSTTPQEILRGQFPQRIVEKAIERMVPRGPLGRQQMSNLKVYAGSEHPHAAQQPVDLDLGARRAQNRR